MMENLENPDRIVMTPRDTPFQVHDEIYSTSSSDGTTRTNSLQSSDEPLRPTLSASRPSTSRNISSTPASKSTEMSLRPTKVVPTSQSVPLEGDPSGGRVSNGSKASQSLIMNFVFFFLKTY